ncbi:MAG: MBL fold metallo-hydrolase [Clostridia bacterium]|nr:MBL fold metallo-hydrolase [Clostridia bacterium]
MARRNKKSKRFYYAFVAVVLIIVIAVAFLDFKFRFGIVNWGSILNESQSDSAVISEVDEIKDLKITFIDVGQGDAILITFPDGKNMLVDAGEGYNSVKGKLDEYLTADGEKIKLDYVVATHTDGDHIGSMAYIYENYEVGYSYRPYVKFSGINSFPDGFLNEGFESKSSKTYGEYLTAVANEGTPNVYFTDETDISVSVNAGDKNIEYSVDFVMPYAKTVEGFRDFTDSNDFSAVMIIKFAGKKIMLTGDMEAKAEQKFVEYYAQNTDEISTLDCDVLKVAHHGSATSSTMGFLNLIKPENAVISTGLCHGTYRHPREEALNNLLAVYAKIYRTDLQGTITLTVSPSGEMTFDMEIPEEFKEYLLCSADEISAIDGLKEEIENYKKNL